MVHITGDVMEADEVIHRVVVRRRKRVVHGVMVEQLLIISVNLVHLQITVMVLDMSHIVHVHHEFEDDLLVMDLSPVRLTENVEVLIIVWFLLGCSLQVLHVLSEQLYELQ